MIIVITRDGKCAGISTVVGSIDTQILTGAAAADIRADLKELSCDKPDLVAGLTNYRIDVREQDGSHQEFVAADDPNSPWSTPLKRILNKTGMIERV